MRYVSGVLTAIALVMGGFLALSGGAGAQAETSIGVDVGVDDDNGPTSIGSIESCLRVSNGDTFSVDLFVSDAEDLLAWESYVAYDSSVLQVVDRDVQMFQAADDGSAVFNTSEAVPGNDDGLFRVGGADIREPPVGDSGSGVLARLTLKAISEGSTTLNAGLTDRNGDGTMDHGTTLTDIDGGHIGDINGDGLFDGEVTAPEVFVDVDPEKECATPFGGGSAETTPEPDAVESLQTDNDSGDGSWWMVIPIVGGVVLAVAALVYGASRIRRRPPSGTGGQ